MKIAQDFQGIDPSFESPLLIPEESGVSADRGSELPGSNRAGQFERLGWLACRQERTEKKRCAGNGCHSEREACTSPKDTATLSHDCLQRSSNKRDAYAKSIASCLENLEAFNRRRPGKYSRVRSGAIIAGNRPFLRLTVSS